MIIFTEKEAYLIQDKPPIVEYHLCCLIEEKRPIVEDHYIALLNKSTR
ncbi:hypothetical protein QFZ72_003232 [Bacillus sp. V2I10]|nr:hypothetical protein [Bacillus sp. V2I10]